MSKVLLALTSVALLGLSGCAGLHVNQPGFAEAQTALPAAQAAVKDARAKNALWTTAENALKAAEAAAAKNDYATVIKESAKASDQVRLGMAQLKYPQVKIGD